MTTPHRPTTIQYVPPDASTSKNWRGSFMFFTRRGCLLEITPDYMTVIEERKNTDWQVLRTAEVTMGITDKRALRIAYRYFMSGKPVRALARVAQNGGWRTYEGEALVRAICPSADGATEIVLCFAPVTLANVVPSVRARS
jgi:hypothetical protein